MCYFNIFMQYLNVYYEDVTVRANFFTTQSICLQLPFYFRYLLLPSPPWIDNKEERMKKLILPAVAAIGFATPALANEARVEARGGVIWDGSDSEDFWGVAAGYDFNLGEKVFAGIEVSGDKIGASETRVAWGFTGRLGARISDSGKIYVDAGHTTKSCDVCDSAKHLGAGYEQGFGKNFYGKIAYRHFFVGSGFLATDGFDAVTAGFGLKF